MMARPDWIVALQADQRFALLEASRAPTAGRWQNLQETLERQGFDDVDIRSLNAGHGPLPVHTHAYDLRVLILAGGVTLGIGGAWRRHGPGDSFELPAGTPHEEAFDPEGYTYLAARRHPGARPAPEPTEVPL